MNFKVFNHSFCSWPIEIKIDRELHDLIKLVRKLGFEKKMFVFQLNCIALVLSPELESRFFLKSIPKANCTTKNAFSALSRLFHRIRLLDFPTLVDPLFYALHTLQPKKLYENTTNRLFLICDRTIWSVEIYNVDLPFDLSDWPRLNQLL